MEIKLKLKVRDVEIELTKDEAIKLKELLDGLTGKEIIKEKEYVPWYPYRWYPYYTQTYWDTYTTTATGNTMKFGEDCQISYTFT